MNMQEHRDRQGAVKYSILESVDQAIAEKMQTGHADEERYGFAARVANATPPLDETSRQRLRARILVELTKSIEQGEYPITTRDHIQVINFWRLSLIGVPALAILILILAFAASARQRAWRPDMEVQVPPAPDAPSSQLASGDIDALVDRLNGESTPRMVVIFPSDYATSLAGRIQHEVVPLTLDDDVSPAALQAALGAILRPSGLVDVIMVSQGATDVARQVRTALERHLYRLYRHPGDTGIDTFGGLERNIFVIGPENATLDPIGAMFEGGIELVAGSALDDPEPGSPLRLGLDWQITEPVDDSLVMFVHLIYNGSRLVAQRDAIPGNGLFPVESWEPGKVVRDQFALLLPTDLPVGEYEIQAGVYSAASGQRYSLTEQGSGTYIVVQKITFEE